MPITARKFKDHEKAFVDASKDLDNIVLPEFNSDAIKEHVQKEIEKILERMGVLNDYICAKKLKPSANEVA